MSEYLSMGNLYYCKICIYRVVQRHECGRMTVQCLKIHWEYPNIFFSNRNHVRDHLSNRILILFRNRTIIKVARFDQLKEQLKLTFYLKKNNKVLEDR